MGGSTGYAGWAPAYPGPNRTQQAAGGWGFSIFSEIFRNAVEVAKSAIADMQQPPEQETGPGAGGEKGTEGEEGGEKDELRKAALDKLENASEDSLLRQPVRVFQGLKVFDSSVESIATGTWQALGSAWKNGSLLVHKYDSLIILVSLSVLMP